MLFSHMLVAAVEILDKVELILEYKNNVGVQS